LDAARIWDLKRHGWRVHATAGSQHVIGDTTYWWHGEARDGNPAHPFVIVQFTLSEWGCFEQDGARHRIGAGNAFLATRFSRGRASQECLLPLFPDSTIPLLHVWFAFFGC
jgi:hypothetical protein